MLSVVVASRDEKREEKIEMPEARSGGTNRCETRRRSLVLLAIDDSVLSSWEINNIICRDNGILFVDCRAGR